MTIYTYLRVSTDKQDYDNQRLGILDFCNKKGWDIDKEIIDDGVSGVKEPINRKLGKLLKEIKCGDILVVSEISRLGRKLFMLFRILENLLNEGVNVYSVKDGYSLDNSIQSKVLAFAFGMAAEIERDMISLRTREALVKKRKEGVILGRPKGRKNSKLKLCDKVSEVSSLLNQGMPKYKIAKKLKVSRNTLNKIIRLYNVNG
ncbi:recombinase family protein [bacterium]|nr:recombinase family protein [bacterium]